MIRKKSIVFDFVLGAVLIGLGVLMLT